MSSTTILVMIDTQRDKPVYLGKKILFFVALSLFGAIFSGLSAQEQVFSYDGKTDRSGKASFSVPVEDGARYLFRLASLDFNPSFSIDVGDTYYDVESEGSSVGEQTVRVSEAGGKAQVSLVGKANASFQFRLLKFPENPALSFNKVQRGTLNETALQDDDGNYIDWYALKVQKGQRIVVGLVGVDSDALLFVELPDGTVESSDDELGTDPRLILTAEESGTWQVGASMFLSEEDYDGFSYDYLVYAQELPKEARSLAVGNAGYKTTLGGIEGIPPLPQEFKTQIPVDGIYEVYVSGGEGFLPRLTLTREAGKSPEKVFTKSMFDLGESSLSFSYFFRKGSQLALLVDSLYVESQTPFSITLKNLGLPTVFSGAQTKGDIAEGAADFFLYKGKAGEYVEFRMTSEEFDTHLELEDEIGQSFSWDDYAEKSEDIAFESRGGYYFENAGELVFAAKGYDNYAVGPYTLSVLSSAKGEIAAPKDYPASYALKDGQELFSRLTSKDKMIDGAYTDEYTVDLKQNDLVSVYYGSADFDSQLRLFTPQGEEFLYNDDFYNQDAYVEFLVPASGKYKIQAFSYESEGAPLNKTYKIRHDRYGAATPLEKDKEGRVDDDSAVDDDGYNYAVHNYRLRNGQQIYLMGTSPDFSVRLELWDASGNFLESNEYFGEASEARLRYLVTRAGNYQVRVVNLSTEEGIYEGAYTLSVYDIK